MNKIKIYVLHYTCGNGEIRISCYKGACDLCNLHTPLYYEEKYMDNDELYKLINDSKIGNYIHISTVKPNGWISKTEYEYFEL